MNAAHTSANELDNQGRSFVKSWRDAEPNYEDTEFGELVYNEPSIPTKLEMLSLLSKDTPSMVVFMHAISMGLGIEDVLQAAIRYQPSKGRDLAASAVHLLPLMGESDKHVYASYYLDDLEREDEVKPYSVEQVVENFFKDRLVLRPYPDWFDGQYHFLASAAELKRLQARQKGIRWYRTRSTQDTRNRPIFVSLYEAGKLVLIDGEDRINQALVTSPDAVLPVVFVFNSLNERPIDKIGYPLTINGIQAAYAEKALMVTPTPEWELGDYHIYAELLEFHQVFDLPKEEDFEPEVWEKLIKEAQNYSVTDTAFLSIVLGSGESDANTAKLAITHQQLYAAWDNPRADETFKYTPSNNAEPLSLEDILGKGLIFNRPDLLAALDSLGVTQVPVTFYYLDSARVKAYRKGPRALIQAAIGAGVPPASFGGGFFSPPPEEAIPPEEMMQSGPPPEEKIPPASPPGIQ